MTDLTPEIEPRRTAIAEDMALANRMPFAALVLRQARAMSLIRHLMRSRRRWQGEAFEHLFTYSLENTERVDTQRQLDAARARIHEWRVHLAEIVDALGLPEDTRFDCLPDEVREARARIAELEAAQRPALGYIAMAREKNSDSPFGILPARNLATDKLSAEMQRERFAKDEDMHVIVAELREVRDA